MWSFFSCGSLKEPFSYLLRRALDLHSSRCDRIVDLIVSLAAFRFLFCFVFPLSWYGYTNCPAPMPGAVRPFIGGPYQGLTHFPKRISLLSWSGSWRITDHLSPSGLLRRISPAPLSNQRPASHHSTTWKCCLSHTPATEGELQLVTGKYYKELLNIFQMYLID